MVLLLGTGVAALAMATALGVRGGVDAQFDALVDSIGRNIYRIDPEVEVMSSACDEQLTREELMWLEGQPGIEEVAGETPHLARYPAAPDEPCHGGFIGVTENYFDLLGLPLEAGRAFEEGEVGAAVLGHELARTLEGDPIGQLFDAGLMTVRVVGVLAPVPNERRQRRAFLDNVVIVSGEDHYAPMAHTPWRQGCEGRFFSLVWAKLDPDDLEAGIAAIDAFTDSDDMVRTLEAAHAFLFRERRRTVLFYAIVAAAILCISLVNVASVASTAAIERTQEIGTRRALGAAGADERRRVMLSLTGLSLAGLALGSLAAWLLAPAIGRLLSIELRWGGWHGAAAGVLVGGTLLAAWLPAWWSGRVPSVRAIRAAAVGSARSLYRGLGLLVLLSASLSIAATLMMAAFSDEMIRFVGETFGAAAPNTVAMAGESRLEHHSFLAPIDLTDDDAAAVLALPGVDRVSSLFTWRHRVTAGDRVLGSQQVLHVGSPGGRVFVPGRLVTGRWPTEEEIASAAHVMLVGREMAEYFYEGYPAVGEDILLGEEIYRVIGVFEGPNSPLLGVDRGDCVVAIPARPDLLPEGGRMPRVYWLDLSRSRNTGETLREIEALLEERQPGKAPPYFEGPATMNPEFVAGLNSITYGLLRLAVLGVVLGGAGVANLLWARARRARQVLGIYRALGENAWRVFWRVAGTGLGLMVAAGAIGIGLAYAGILPLTQRYYGVTPTLSWMWLLRAGLAVFLAALIGGGIPALWAARLVPAQTIRSGRE